MKPVALTHYDTDFQRSSLKLLCKNFTIKFYTEGTTIPFDDVEVLFVSPLLFPWLGHELYRFPNLKVIASNTSETCHIALAEAEKRGIKVLTLSPLDTQTITATAEHTLALILAAYRTIPTVCNKTPYRNWDRRLVPAPPKMLSRMTLGIIGYGRLGKMLHERTNKLFERVLHVDKMDEILPILKHLDIVSLHVPLTPKTDGLVDSYFLRELPIGSILVNTSRGEVVNIPDLLEALNTRRLRAAALDVLPGEFAEGFSSSWPKSAIAQYAAYYNNLILTPHVGGSTRDAWEETEHLIIRKAVEAMKEIRTFKHGN